MKTLSLFVGSPDDTAGERKEVLRIVDRVNRSVGPKVALRIEVALWEDIPSEMGRPQSVINKALDDADIFLGIVGYWWGAPTGEFDSGFAEEFHRSKSRWEESSKPEIWLYFKDIPEERLRDPGTSLQQVIDFRASIQEKRVALFSEFDTVQTFGEKLCDQLTSHLLSVADTNTETNDDGATTKTQDVGATTPSIPPPGIVPGEGLAKAFEKAASAATQGETPAVDGVRDSKTIARVFFAASSWLAPVGGSSVLPLQESHLLYGFREQFRLTPRELVHALAGAISGGESTRPGWVWLREVPSENLIAVIELFTRDMEPALRAAAIRTLGLIGESHRLKIRQIEALLSDADDDVVEATVRLLGTRQDPSSLVLLRRVARNGNSAAEDVLFERLLASEPTKALEFVRSNHELLTTKRLDQLADRSKVIAKRNAEHLLKAKDAQFRVLALRLAHGLTSVRRKDVEPLLEDSDVRVRAECVRTILARNWQIDRSKLLEALETEATEIGTYSLRQKTERGVLASLDYETLLGMLDWLGALAIDVYSVLAEDHFDRFGRQVRLDFDGKFGDLKDRMIELWNKKHPDIDGHDLKVMEELASKMSERLTQAALDGLASNGTRADLKRVVGLLQDTSAQGSALGLFGRVGNAADARYLIEFSGGGNHWPEIASDAVASIATRHPSVIDLLLKSRVTAFVAAGMRLANQRPGNRWEKQARDLLSFENWSIRKSACRYLEARLSSATLKDLLNEYRDGEFYYYNVICWLDRVLYAPEPFRSAYRKSLSG